MITINSDGTVTGGTIKSPGNVIQLINTAETNMMETTSTSYVDFTGATLNITPSSSSNKILVMFSCYWVNTLVGSSNVNCSFKTLRDSTTSMRVFIQQKAGLVVYKQKVL